MISAAPSRPVVSVSNTTMSCRSTRLAVLIARSLSLSWTTIISPLCAAAASLTRRRVLSLLRRNIRTSSGGDGFSRILMSMTRLNQDPDDRE